MSEGRPVALLDVSYDDGSGFYGALSGSAILGSSDAVRPLGLVLNGGYAKRLSSGLTIDIGAVQSNYSRYASRASASYTDFYVGVTRKYLSARLTFSPHYFERDARAFYGEVDGNFSPLRKLTFNAHAGLLVPIRYGRNRESARAQYDWRIGAARQAGRTSFHLILTGGGPERDFYRGRSHSRDALILGLSYAL